MEILKIIHIFVDAIKKDLSYKYNTYIQDIYDKTKIVVNDYFEILNKTKHFLESHQKTLDEIIDETLSAVSSERTSRVIDNEAAGSMERRKREGYF